MSFIRILNSHVTLNNLFTSPAYFFFLYSWHIVSRLIPRKYSCDDVIFLHKTSHSDLPSSPKFQIWILLLGSKYSNLCVKRVFSLSLSIAIPFHLFSNGAESPRRALEMCGGIFGYHKDWAGVGGGCVNRVADSGFSICRDLPLCLPHTIKNCSTQSASLPHPHPIKKQCGLGRFNYSLF